MIPKYLFVANKAINDEMYLCKVQTDKISAGIYNKYSPYQ